MNAEYPKGVLEVLQKLEAAGYEAWCVGGCVRDLLLGRPVNDWDVTTSALPEETMALFGDAAFPTGLKHGTVTVRADGMPVEVTTYRCDGNYLDHRRPESVTFTRSLEEDLQRRDFTINAIAVNLRGEVRDPFDGMVDIKTKTLRCVGNADQRFEEDALRMMRGLRFSAVLGFSVAPATEKSIRNQRELLREIAVERIWTELEKLLMGLHASAVLRCFPEVIGVFWPEILPMVGLDQRNRHHCYDVWEHSLRAVEAVPSDLVLRCAALLHDVGKPPCFTVDEKGIGHFYGHGVVSRQLTDEMLRRMKCSADFRERVVRLVDWHDRPIPCTEKSLRRALRKLGEEELRLLLELKRADNLAQAPEYRSRQQELDALEELLQTLLDQDACFSLRQLAVNGNDLLALGLSGPEVGAALEKLLSAVVDGEVPNDRHALLDYLARR